MIHLGLWAAGLRQAETQTTARERTCLTRYASGSECAVEIGVWHGVTTATILRAMPARGVLYAVDPFPRGRMGFSIPRMIARREVARIANARVRWVRSTGAAAPDIVGSEVAGRVQLLFVDGAHDYESVAADWRAWRPLLAAGAVAAFHDSVAVRGRPFSEEVAAVVQRLVLSDPSVRRVDQVDTLTVVQVVHGCEERALRDEE